MESTFALASDLSSTYKRIFEHFSDPLAVCLLFVTRQKFAGNKYIFSLNRPQPKWFLAIVRSV